MTRRGVTASGDGETWHVTLVVERLSGATPDDAHYLVVFQPEAAPDLHPAERRRVEDEEVVRSLEQELTNTKERLQTALEELETSNEELETSREELQSINEELRTVDNELNSRVAELSQANNALASVQSIVRFTAQGASFLEEFEERLFGRVQAMAAGHNRISDADWQHAELEELAKSVLDPFTEGDSVRLRLSGPGIWLHPDAAVPVAMILHELATNAAKYGAWSASDGKVRLDWQLGDDGRLRLSWTETGGEKVKEPGSRASGSSSSGRARNTTSTANATWHLIPVDFPAPSLCRLPKRSRRRTASRPTPHAKHRSRRCGRGATQGVRRHRLGHQRRVTKPLGHVGAVVAAQEDKGDAALVEQIGQRPHRSSAEMNVEDGAVEHGLLGDAEALLQPPDRPHHRAVELTHQMRDVHRDPQVVFRDEDAGRMLCHLPSAVGTGTAASS